MKKLFILLVSVLCVLPCITFAQKATTHINKAKKAYEQGNYYQASYESMLALRINPKKKKPQEILSYSYELAVEDIQDKIRSKETASLDFDGTETIIQREKIVQHFNDLIKIDKLNREVNKIVSKSKYNISFNRIDVTNELTSAKKMLNEAYQDGAEMHYQTGLQLIQQAGRKNQKKAAKEFKKASNYVSNYKQSEELYQKAKKEAITRVAIFDFENKSHNTNFGAVGEAVSDKLASSILSNHEAMEFTELVTRDDLALLVQEHNLNMSEDIDENTVVQFGSLMGVHIIITGKVTQISCEHQPLIKDSPYTSTKKVKTGTETYVNKKGKTATRSVYGTVYAQVFEHRKQSKAVINGSYKMLDVKTGKILDSNQFSENYDWENNWITYTGNQKAIDKGKYSNYDLNELNPPTDFEMQNLLTKKLVGKIGASVVRNLK